MPQIWCTHFFHWVTLLSERLPIADKKEFPLLQRPWGQPFDKSVPWLPQLHWGTWCLLPRLSYLPLWIRSCCILLQTLAWLREAWQKANCLDWTLNPNAQLTSLLTSFTLVYYWSCHPSPCLFPSSVFYPLVEYVRISLPLTWSLPYFSLWNSRYVPTRNFPYPITQTNP